jgi:glutamate-1-semialdehyde 2,1-aminomutase
MNPRTQSDRLWDAAQRVLPGGVNSPVRAFRAVGGTPVFLRSGEGAHVEDVDGNRYIDYVASWGPLVLGHAPAPVLRAVEEAARRGTSFGAPTAAEVEMAELLVEAVPSLERVRLVNSGTEATMSAIRVARGFTGRAKVIKAAGCYHGHADHLLAKAGSGAMTFGVPDSAGVPEDFARHTVLVPYNDPDAVQEAVDVHGGEIACLILEPVAGNMGLVPPEAGYLSAVREITARAGVLLIFDEVITGFRVAYGGAQQRYGVVPDMTCLGKIVGGGLPVGAYGGRADIMASVAPEGAVYQAGTLSGNPLATAAGIATLRALREPGVYDRLEASGRRLEEALRHAVESEGIPAHVTRVGSMLCLFFARPPVRNYDDARRADTRQYARWFHALLERGIYLPPAQFETWFVSLAHTAADIDRTTDAMRDALRALRAA